MLIGRDSDSKKKIKELCGVSDGMIGRLRRVMKEFTDGPQARELQGKLGGALKNTTWFKVHLVWRGYEKEQIDDEERAAGLAKTLRSRMDDRLSRDPEVTAKALMLYDLDLLHPLSKELQELTATKTEDDDADISPELADILAQLKRREEVPDEVLRKQLIEHEQKYAKREAIISEIKTELQVRGALPKSELIWEKWQLEDTLAKAKKREQENATEEE